jgi:LmbE family N-acetylglucosaminyl deacetylase
MVVAAGNAAWLSLRLRGSPKLPSHARHEGRWLIIAPHPDDETLGTGGLIARFAQEGNPAWIVFLTAGEASHIGAPSWPPERIARTRRREARRALRALGHPGDRVTFLGWPDSKPHAPDSPDFKRSGAFLIGLCRRGQLGTVVTPWRGEDHCDHLAAFQLAEYVVRRAHGRIALLEYLVWGWKRPRLSHEVRDFGVVTLDAANFRRRRRTALSRHRTQISPLIQDAREAFRLPSDMVALAVRDPTILLRGRVRHAT